MNAFAAQALTLLESLPRDGAGCSDAHGKCSRHACKQSQHYIEHRGLEEWRLSKLTEFAQPRASAPPKGTPHISEPQPKFFSQYDKKC